jgi:glycosyltransferase involved in cell wall biosynthesis
MPNVLLEALAFDLPIVATDCQSGPREILVEPRLGSLVPVGDWTRMAHAMTEALLAGKDPYRRNYVAERFEISAVMRRYQSAILGPP